MAICRTSGTNFNRHATVISARAQVPLGVLVLKAGVVRPVDEVEREAVAGLPKTRSGKMLRNTMRKIAEGEGYPLPATIDDSAALVEIDRALAAVGYAKR